MVGRGKPTNSGRWFAAASELSPFRYDCFHVKRVAAAATLPTDRRLSVQQILGKLAAPMELGRENSGQVQDVAAVGEEVAPVPAPSIQPS